MNMKQSCKALICAIEGELDGRHCTEEQAAAILDHALPSLTEALTRAEADNRQLQLIVNSHANMRDTAQAQLAEAVGLIEKSADLAGELGDYLVSLAKRHSGTELLDQERNLRAFLARHAQSEQQGYQGAQAVDDYKAWYEEAIVASNELGFAGMSAADVIKYQGEELAEARAALATQPAKWSCLNEWFLSLEPGRQAVLRDDKWMLAGAAFEAGQATQPAAGEPEQQTAINADDLPTKKYPLGAFNFAAPVAAGEPVGWIIDWPDEPELGHYFGDSPAGTGSRSRPLYAAPPAAAPVAEFISHPKGKQLIFLVNGEVELPVGTKLYKAAPPAAAHGDGLHFNTAEDLASAIRQVSAYEDLGPELIADEMFKQAGAIGAEHGDEEVRKDAAAAYVAMSCNSVLIDGSTCYYLPAERMAAFDRMFSLGDAMRAQAGEGGEV